ncbi:MAG: hypothetical protein ACREJO_05560 [Phycisphaerales bacterium]
MSQFPATAPGGGALKPHRGTLVLVFAILGIFVCIIFAILAWVWGSADLKEMDAGRMDPSGRGTTQAGKIIGMIWCILAVVMFIVYIALFVLLGVGAVAGAAAGGAGGGTP